MLCFPLVIVRYERERYSVEEEDGSVTLALVLNFAVSFPVTVYVRTLNLLDNSVGDAATGELELPVKNVLQTFIDLLADTCCSAVIIVFVHIHTNKII